LLYIFRRQWKDGDIARLRDNRLAARLHVGRQRHVMKAKTIEALRAEARELGLTGYSKLRKDELLKLIASRKRKITAKPAPKARANPKRTTKVRNKSRRSTTDIASSVPVMASRVPRTKPLAETQSDVEQQVESAKYAFAPPGTNVQEPAYAGYLDEDIDRLPMIHEPLLCLLPQKPGVMHGYWLLPPTTFAAAHSIRLRLSHHAGNLPTILEEQLVRSERGHWYFHVGEGIEPGAIYLQLGHYQPDGAFVSIIQRSIARIPSLYASTHTDRSWWVSDAEFRAMYRRAGGIQRDRNLGWAGSTSSPGGAPVLPGRRIDR
jgi:hypothetical protein